MMVIHKECGGRMLVKDSMQIDQGNGIAIVRLRKCAICGAIIHSTEIIPEGVSIVDGYRHNPYVGGK